MIFHQKKTDTAVFVKCFGLATPFKLKNYEEPPRTMHLYRKLFDVGVGIVRIVIRGMRLISFVQLK